MSNFDEFSKISPKFQKKLKRASEIKDERMPLSSIGLTTALGGGICYGAVSVFMGNTGSGKTALALASAGKAQREQGKSVAMIDSEKSFKPEWGESLGVDVDQMGWFGVGDIANATDLMVELIQKAKTDIIIVDSISSLATSSHVNKETGEIMGFNDNNQMARRAVELEKMLVDINFANENTAVILISQIRNTITSAGARGFHASGGKAMEHMPAANISLTSSQSVKERLKGNVAYGNRLIEKPIGMSVDWKLIKQRGTGSGQTGQYNYYYAGDRIGVDNLAELIDVASEQGHLDKGGAWYTLENGEKIQGQEKLVKYYLANPAEFDKLEQKVLNG